MCGICGVAAFHDRTEPPSEALLERMATAMIHRGPDDVGLRVRSRVGLAVRRLAIVDVDGGGQPLLSEDGEISLVCNGEIYNAPDLRQGLEQRGHRFATDSDCEVIVHLYEERGIDALDALRGMFAFALHDARTETLYLARDPFGIKPLYHAVSPSGRLVFASEIKAILASGAVDPRLDPTALWHYLTFQYVPGTRTLFEGISRLAPGGYLMAREGLRREVIWKNLHIDPDPRLTLPESVEAIRQTVAESVEAHVMGDVPVGAFLSSGIDSSYLTALLARGGRASTYTVGFEGAAAMMSEFEGAREVSQALGTDHHEITISAQRYAETLPKIVWHQEDPVADPAAPGIFFVTEAARGDLKVLLSGEGADEIFGGYPIYREPSSLALFDHLPPGLRMALGRLARRLPEGMKGRSFFMRGSVPLESRFLGGARIFSEEDKRALLPDLAGDGREPSMSLAALYYGMSRHLDPVSRMQELDLNLWLPGDILAKADKMSMANAIELRVPFLDREVFDLARRLPPEQKVRGPMTKVALRQAADSVLPSGVSSRPKLGFPVPFRPWFRGPLRDFVHDVLGELQSVDVLDAKAVGRVLEEQDQGLDRSRQIFTLMSFGLWHQAFINDAQNAPAGTMTGD